MVSSAQSLSARERLPFGTALGGSFICQTGYCLVDELLNKTNKIFTFYSDEFWILTDWVAVMGSEGHFWQLRGPWETQAWHPQTAFSFLLFPGAVGKFLSVLSSTFFVSSSWPNWLPKLTLDDCHWLHVENCWQSSPKSHRIRILSPWLSLWFHVAGGSRKLAWIQCVLCS